VDSLDLQALGYPQRPALAWTDDRLARALDKLYRADRSCLLTRLVVAAVQTFEVQIPRIHNDSTPLKTYGRMPGWVEGRRFLDPWGTAPLPKHLLWRRSQGQNKNEEASQAYFLFEGQYAFDHGGYPLYGYYLTQKQKRDRPSRQERMEVARAELATLATQLNRAHWKEKPDILRKAQAILDHYQVCWSSSSPG
jgi:hypothetical protein